MGVALSRVFLACRSLPGKFEVGVVTKMGVVWLNEMGVYLELCRR